MDLNLKRTTCVLREMEATLQINFVISFLYFNNMYWKYFSEISNFVLNLFIVHVGGRFYMSDYICTWECWRKYTTYFVTSKDDILCNYKFKLLVCSIFRKILLALGDYLIVLKISNVYGFCFLCLYQVFLGCRWLFSQIFFLLCELPWHLSRDSEVVSCYFLYGLKIRVGLLLD